MTQDIFKTNPQLEVAYQTSDKQCFYTECDARNHAKTLEVKSVKTLTRENQKEPEQEVDEEREQYAARYEELFGKKPAHNIGLEKLKKQVQEKEAELETASAETEGVEGSQVGEENTED